MKPEKPTELAILHYSHRHGDDLIPVVLESGLPEITNELLKKLDVWEPELERDDEYAEWKKPISLRRIPILKSPRDWSPRRSDRDNMYIAILSLYDPHEGLGAGMVLVPHGAQENLPPITKELLESFGIHYFDLEDEDYVAGWVGPIGPVNSLPKV